MASMSEPTLSPWDLTPDEFVALAVGRDKAGRAWCARIAKAVLLPWPDKYAVLAHLLRGEERVSRWVATERGGSALPFARLFSAPDQMSPDERRTAQNVELRSSEVLVVGEHGETYVPATLRNPFFDWVDQPGAGKATLCHEAVVRAALASGREVPQRVLDAYGDLQRRVVPPVRDGRATSEMTRAERVHAKRSLYMPIVKQPAVDKENNFLTWRREWELPSVGDLLDTPRPTYALLVVDLGLAIARGLPYSAAISRFHTKNSTKIPEVLGRVDPSLRWQVPAAISAAVGHFDYDAEIDLVRRVEPHLVPDLPVLAHYHAVTLRPDARILHWYGSVRYESGAPYEKPPWLRDMSEWLLRHMAGLPRAVRQIVEALDVSDDAFYFETLALKYAQLFGYDAMESLSRGICLLNPLAIDRLEPVPLPEDQVVPLRSVLQAEQAAGVVHGRDALIERLLAEPRREEVLEHLHVLGRTFDILLRALAALREATTMHARATTGLQALDLVRMAFIVMGRIGRAGGVRDGRICANIANKMAMPNLERRTPPAGYAGWTEEEVALSIYWSETQNIEVQPGDSDHCLGYAISRLQDYAERVRRPADPGVPGPDLHETDVFFSSLFLDLRSLVMARPLSFHAWADIILLESVSLEWGQS